MSHTPIDLTRLAAGRLEKEGIENARLEAELLLAHVLDLKRLDLYLQHDRPLTEVELDAYREVVRRRLRREPLQYITGRVGFRQLELKVDGRALIPRPETEVLVGAVLEWAEERSASDARRSLTDDGRRTTEAGGPTDDRRRTTDAGTGSGTEHTDVGDAGGGSPDTGAVGRHRSSVAGPPSSERSELSALDLCTGTGAIALSLAREGPFSRVVATDTSAGALALAAENAERLGLAGRVELRRGDLWQAVEVGERFDVVVSNPPYIARSEREGLMPEVRDWEPAEALFAGTDGRAILDAIVRGAPERLLPGGLLAVEVGSGQAPAVVALVERTLGLEKPRIVEDLTGRGRIVLARRADMDRHTGAS